MKTLLTAAVAAAFLAGAAQAASETVTLGGSTATIRGVTFSTNNGNAVPGTQYDQSNNGGGSTSVTGGVLTVNGDRSRYIIGSLYDYATAPSFKLNDLTSMTWSWSVQSEGAAPAGQYHAPVGRVIVGDAGGVRTELIWEFVEGNGGSTSSATTLNQTFSTTASSKWYANYRTGSATQARTNGGLGAEYTLSAGDSGRLYLNGSQVLNTLDDWSTYFTADARVIGISFGAGSGFGQGFSGQVSNVVVTTADATAAVPEPATWGMMLLGFGAVGMAARRRRTALAVA